MKNKKNILLMSIGAITLIAVTLGATYAYFTAQSGGGANIDTNVITGTTDNLAFSFGDVINIFATEENFGQGMGSISDSTTGQAILKANNTTNEATARYNIYLIIENNDFVYTTENQTPEIVLNVTDPNGNLVENITGLVHYENGFDITTRTGGYLLVPDYEISATDTQTIQDWNIEITLVNLNSDQNANTGKSLTGKLYITQDQMSSYELTEINNIETTTTYNSIDATLDLTNGSAPVSKYYYGIEKVNNTRSAETVEYVESDSPNYKFTNLEENTEYTIYSYVIDENKIKSNVYETTVETGTFVAPMINTVVHSSTLNSITLNVTSTPGSNEIVKYMYSKDNGASWEESTSTTYTFDGLTDSTEYKIKVKAIDSEDNESTEYYAAITTEIYILPVINSVEATTTWNSITVTPTGTDGTNTISKYMYQINDGAYQESNVFDNLNEQTNYIIKIKAIDSIGRESNEYSLQVKTDAYKLPTITEITTSSTSDSITINVNATPGDGSIVSYHYSKDDGSNYQTSNSNSYTFSDLTKNTTYYLKIYATDSNGRTSTLYSTEKMTTDLTLADVCQNGENLASCIQTYCETYGEGTGGLYYHDGHGTYDNVDYEANDDSYRYAGANPNNYVCFGSDAATCPNDNLYRIVGKFDNQIKLIKYDYAGSSTLGSEPAKNSTPSSTYYRGNLDSIPNYYWSGLNTTSNNFWVNSSLNTDVLNSTYLDILGSNWTNKIATTNWKVGRNLFDDIVNTRLDEVYENEMFNSNDSETYSAKIGLMYASDYAYAASPENWNLTLYEYDSDTNINNNWMFMGANEWIMISCSNVSSNAFRITRTGYFDSSGVYSDNAIRPTFYLNSNVVYVSGTGTQTDPYRIS